MLLIFKSFQWPIILKALREVPSLQIQIDPEKLEILVSLEPWFGLILLIRLQNYKNYNVYMIKTSRYENTQQ